MPKKKVSLSYEEEMLDKMGFVVFLKAGKLWLDTRSKYLNAALGSKKYGLPAGKMYGIQGKPHAGKTALVMFLAALAQKVFGAFVIWVDLENSLTNESNHSKEFRNSWASKFKLKTDRENFYRVYPKVLVAKKQRKKGKKILANAGDIYIQAAESLFDETEFMMKEVKVKDRERPIFVAVDSIANIQTAMSSGSHEEKNMRTALDRAIFLSGALPKWQTLAHNFTAWMFFINQIRTKPGVSFGNPEYSPGGFGLEHNAHSLVNMRPYKKGIIMGENGDAIGVRGSIVNVKNKVGGHSKTGNKAGYHVDLTRHGSHMWSFESFDELKGEK